MSHFEPHLDETSALLFLDGELEPAGAQELSKHAAGCSDCRELLVALKNENVWLYEALTAQDDPVPARLLAAPERGAAPWGWIAAFGLGVAGAGTVWTAYIEPWLAQAAQAGFTRGNLLTTLFFSGAFWKGWDAVLNMMEFLATATLGTIAILLLRRHRRGLVPAAAMLGAVLCALGLPPAARAAETKRGEPNYTLPAGQEVKTDLIVAAQRTQIDGTVDGDLIVTSHIVTVNGRVKGDILCFAQDLLVNGTVDGNIRSYTQTLLLDGFVGKNVTDGSQELDLADKAKIGGTLTFWVADAALDGEVAGNVLAHAGSLQINGTLDSNATLHAGRLAIGPAARIKGETKYEGGRQPDISPSAQLAAPINITTTTSKRGSKYTQAIYYWHRTLLWAASFVFGLVLLMLAPGFFTDAEKACRRAGPCIGIGFLLLVATPVAALIACITIVGLGLGIAALLLYLIALYSAQVFVGSWLGEKLLGANAGAGAALGRLALGLALLRVARMLPYLGGWITFLIVIWGMGAIALAVYKRLQPETPLAA